MPRSVVSYYSRFVPRVAVLAILAIGVAACSDSARFDSNPFASNRSAPPETTGSISQRPLSNSRVVSQPLPSPTRPSTVASNGYSNGAQGLGAYRPGSQPTEVTGSVPAHRPAAPPPAVAQAGWTWDGGSPVTVGQGETVASIARKYGVPESAIMQTNGIADPNSVRPGQRLVIPRYTAAREAPPREAPPPRQQAAAPPPVEHGKTAENVHVVEPGETMLGIAKRHGTTISALAKANNIQPYAKISIGDRLIIPGERRPMQQATRQSPPQIGRPSTQPAEHVASIPAQNARVAAPEAPPEEPSAVKTAQAMPSFRWPVHGRVIAAFGSKQNGQTNDGINVAVPEGTPIKAADDGVVAYAGNELKGYGNLVLIRHSNGFVSAYANASELMVKRGDTIKRGQTIARSGQTGNVSSPQLHFEIRKGSTPVDPAQYLHGA